MTSLLSGSTQITGYIRHPIFQSPDAVRIQDQIVVGTERSQESLTTPQCYQYSVITDRIARLEVRKSKQDVRLAASPPPLPVSG